MRLRFELVDSGCSSSHPTTAEPRRIDALLASFIVKRAVIRRAPSGCAWLLPLLGCWSIWVCAQEAPKIAQGPQRLRARPGEQVSLTVEAQGEGLRYQWSCGTAVLDGRTNATLTLTNVQPSDTAGYRVVVSNSGGSVESGPAGVVVTEAAPAELWNRVTVGPVAVERRDAETGAFLGSAATTGAWSAGQGFDRGPDGLVYVPANTANALERYQPSTGKYVDRIDLGGSENSRTVTGFAWGNDGNLYLSNPPARSVSALNGVTFVRVARLTSWDVPSGFQGSEDVQIAPDGTVLVASSGDGTVKSFRAGDGQFLGSTEAAKTRGLSQLSAFARRWDGDLLAADVTVGGAIHRFRGGDGGYAGIFIAGGAGGMVRPRSLCFGEDGVLYVMDESCIRRFHRQTGEFIDCIAAGSTAPPLRYVSAAPVVRPEIAQSPVGGHFAGGLGVTLAGTFGGTPPFRFQWLRAGTNLAGANSHPLRLAGSLLTDPGEYQVVLWNGAGGATSAVAQVTFYPGAPEILGMTSPQTFTAGQQLTVGPTNVLGHGSFAYRWLRVLSSTVGTSAHTTFVEVPGSTNVMLAFDPALERHTGFYQLEVANDFGATRQTVEVRVVPSLQPQILDQPMNLNALAGAPVEAPLLLSGQGPLHTAWTLDGLVLTGQVLPAPQLPLRPTNFSATLVAVVSNQFGTVTSAPIALRVVGTNRYRQDFSGRTAPGWIPTFSSGAFDTRWGRNGFVKELGRFQLTNEVPLGEVVFGFDVWAQNSWDGLHGWYGMDRWGVWLEGEPLWLGAFSNNDDRERPSYFTQRVPATPAAPELDPRLGGIGSARSIPIGGPCRPTWAVCRWIRSTGSAFQSPILPPSSRLPSKPSN
ncbi:MAG: hypothetical protein FJ387_18145 [Verrucomicrobia bacterium]|nr:hypothetical protein [Verrucomicrobiota bacterium]